MVFKRRTPKTWVKFTADLIYPRGGWGRALAYMKHRLNRLPDPPERIARGVYAGMFACFSPFFGLHMIVAVVVAKVLRGHVIASLITTFVSNPFTFPFLASASLHVGYLIMRKPIDEINVRLFLRETGGFFEDLWHNSLAQFTGEAVDWGASAHFYDDIFLPYLFGGVFIGTVLGLLSYYATVPTVRLYQKRRAMRVAARRHDLPKER